MEGSQSPGRMALDTAELVLDCQNTHGEGVFWNTRDSRLWWTDIHGRKLWSLDPVTGDARSLDMPDRVCCFAPRAQGGFVVAFADGLYFMEESGVFSSFYEFEPGNTETRTNDGRTDPLGRLVVGGMNEASGRPDSSVIRLDADGSVTTIITGVSCANSTCFSPDGSTMYFADSPEKIIRAYPYDPETGRVGSPYAFADMREQPGLPDGSCVDAEGGLWNAVWEGRRVVRYDDTGRVDRVVDLPVGKVTCCAFGGADLDTLYMTTSRLGSDAARIASEPQSGGLFAIKPGIRGLIDAPFAG